MVNSLRIKGLEIQRSSDPVEIERKTGQASESARVYDSIVGENQAFKQAMKDERVRRGLTEDDIRHVFNIIDNDRTTKEEP